MMRNIGLIIFSLFALFVSAQEPLFENTSVIKTVDLTEAIVAVTLRFQVKPLGEDLVDYQVALLNSEIEHMAYIEASSVKKIPISIKKAKVQDQCVFHSELISSDGVTLFNVHFAEKIQEGTVLYVNYYLTHVLVPLPSMITQVGAVLLFNCRKQPPNMCLLILCMSSLPTHLRSRRFATSSPRRLYSPFQTFLRMSNLMLC